MQELRTLGKGGFGLVVAAVNRLDGRQYAVKKIRMPAGVPSGRSRLQAPNVVRYFQASRDPRPQGLGPNSPLIPSATRPPSWATSGAPSLCAKHPHFLG